MSSRKPFCNRNRTSISCLQLDSKWWKSWITLMSKHDSVTEMALRQRNKTFWKIPLSGICSHACLCLVYIALFRWWKELMGDNFNYHKRQETLVVWVTEKRAQQCRDHQNGDHSHICALKLLQSLFRNGKTRLGVGFRRWLSICEGLSAAPTSIFITFCFSWWSCSCSVLTSTSCESKKEKI